jgi:hypothetical protein
MRASDRWVCWRLSVRARTGYGAADVAVRGRRRARERQLSRQLRLAFFKLNFLQNFKLKLLEPSIPKLLSKLTSITFAKADRGFIQGIEQEWYAKLAKNSPLMNRRRTH